MKTVGNTKIVNIMTKEAKGAPIAFLKDIINPHKGYLKKGDQSYSNFDSPFFTVLPEVLV